MKKIFRSLAALAVVMFAGCVNDLTNEVVEPSGKTTVTVGIADTKTSLGDLVEGTRKVYWSEGDQISINGAASSSVVLSKDKRSATFTFDDPELTHPYSVLYPAEMFKDALTITLPAVQAAADNSFGADAAPMATYQAEAGNIVLQHLAGVVRLQVKLPAASTHASHMLSKVEFRGKAGEQVSGDFAIDYQQVSLESASSDDAGKVVTAKVGKNLSSESNVDVFVVVPAIRYEQGFSVRLIDAEGHYMDIATNDITVSKGEIKAMPPVEFVPAGTLVGVEIASAADLVKFAKAYNAGEYAELDNLNVQVTSDIVFDNETNEEWANIGCIGGTQWFAGAFDGKEHTIKNWVASRPLFYGTTANTCIKNLSIDASCTLTAPYLEDQYYGALVGYHTGLLSNCHNFASVAVSGEWATAANVGGLVGRVAARGKIDQCSMSGDITADATFVVSGTVYLGGIAGCIAAAGGQISYSHFSGSLASSGRSLETVNENNAVTAGVNYVGGITGLVGGTVENCYTAASQSVSAEYETAYVQTMFLGGIAGSVKSDGSLADSQNNASVSFSSPKPTTSAMAYVGGVAGALGGGNNSTVSVSMSDCENNGSVQSHSDYHNVFVGGIAAHAVKVAVVDKCYNRVNGTVRATKHTNGLEYIYMGGVIGRSLTSNLSNLSNAAAVEIENLVSTRGALNIGGCVGMLDSSIEGNNTILNSGNITAKGECSATNYIAQGGVVGTMYVANGELSYVKNTGWVTDEISIIHKHVFSGGVVGLVRNTATIDNVTNEGRIHFANSSVLIHENVALGGVVGGISALSNNNFAVTVSNSTNSGEVSRIASTSGIQKSAMVCGGIVGILKGAGSSVENCTNSGLVKMEGLNSTRLDADNDPITTNANGGSCHTAGGIVGFARGASGTPVTISGCTNTGECYAARGYVGGIAGYVRDGEISASHHNTKTVSGVNFKTRTGGIAGYINASSVKSCTVEATIDGGADALAGGVCSGMNGTSRIESSTFNGTIKYTSGSAGAIVKSTVVGATIIDCKAKGQMNKNGTVATITLEHFDADGKATQTGSEILP